MPDSNLPVPVLQHPHWRVVIRPESYRSHLIPSLGECFSIVERSKVSLRGWDYPHLSHRDPERGYGDNWVGSWCDFMDLYEYWRFYQSGQFIHLRSVREATNKEWSQKLRRLAEGMLDLDDGELAKVPGFISIVNLIYNVTEVFEFAARLCATGLYQGSVDITVEIKGIEGFVLMADADRLWYRYFAARQNSLSNTWTVPVDTLLSTSSQQSLAAIVWFFERFGWMDPNEEVIRKDQETLLQRRR